MTKKQFSYVTGERLDVLTFKPRFVTEKELGELSNLWATSRTACSAPGDGMRSAGARRYQRLVWTAREFVKTHPDVSETAAYKDLSDMLDFGGVG